jgi:AraC family transcriptional regulator
MTNALSSRSAGRLIHHRYVGRYAAVAHQWFASGVVLPWHEHGHASLSVVLSGSMGEAWGATAAEFGPGEVLYKPPATLHRNEFHETELLSVEIDAPRLQAEWGAERLPAEARAQFAPRIRVAAGRLVRELAMVDHDHSAAIRIEGLTLELIGEVCRAGMERALPHAPPWLLRVEERLRAEFIRPATLAAYARDAGVHPAHLSRAFRTCYGGSVGGMVRKLRVEFAARRLAQTAASLADIAKAAGFADQSHFTHAFRRETGITPGRYRRDTVPKRLGERDGAFAPLTIPA